MSRPLIVTLTGASGCGKTTVCERVGALARSRGWRAGGLLTLPRRSGARIVGLDVKDLSSGERRPLAEDRGPTDGPSTGRWHFHREALEWGNARLMEAAAIDLLVIDELGPLELALGQGWVHAVDMLCAGKYSLALVVVRSSLLRLFRQRVPGTDEPVLVVGPENRDHLPEMLAARIAGRA